jgi:hypothetical protein
LGCHPVAVHIYTQTIHRTTQITTEQHKITTNVEECGTCPVFASFTLKFVLQLRKKHGKTSDRLKRTLVTVHYTFTKHPHITKPSQTHTLQNSHINTHTHTNYKTHTHITKHAHTQIKKKHTHKLQNTHT